MLKKHIIMDLAPGSTQSRVITPAYGVMGCYQAPGDLPAGPKRPGPAKAPGLPVFAMTRRRRSKTRCMRFAARVQVWTMTGRYLFCAHREQAQQLVAQGLAVPASSSGDRIWRVSLLQVTSVKPRLKPSTRLPMPSASIFLEVLGYREQRLATYTFRRQRLADLLTHLVPERNVVGNFLVPSLDLEEDTNGELVS